jgi:hypothetical protein
MRRLNRQQREREAWTRHIDGGAEGHAPGQCSECNAEIPPERLKKKIKTCSAECGKAAQTSKYGGQRVTFNGRSYPSQRQANVAMKLQALAAAGKITNLKEEDRITLVEGRPGLRGIFYYADFTFYEGPVFHVIDAKGMKTAVYLLKKQLAALLLNITIEEE